MESFQLMQDKELFKYKNMDVMSFEEFQGLFKWLIESYDVGFDIIGLNEIAALAMPGNIASKRVIEKIGMKYKYIVASPQEHELYSITKNEYYKIYNC